MDLGGGAGLQSWGAYASFVLEIGRAADTKERLLRAGEHLFAREGIKGARARDISALAGQRNPSALHYHFGTRKDLVEAILVRYQSTVDAEVERALDDVEAIGAVSAASVVLSAVGPQLRSLATARGRDCARIVPQMVSALTANLRRGVPEPSTAQGRRVLALLEGRMSGYPTSVRWERLALYSMIVANCIADRAVELEGDAPVAMRDAEYRDHLVGVLAAIIDAPNPALPS